MKIRQKNPSLLRRGLFYKFLFVLTLFYSPLIGAKYQVCSVTINSSDEIETFKEFLSPKDFQFVELLPSQKNEKQDHSWHWFDSACEKDYRCDIFLVSGHFGGAFFGESGYSLPISLLEEKACQNKCPGILSHAKEIFLFGCNTLADKKRDRRSDVEYLKVLLDDGMARETAERVVACRYSPLCASFYSRVNFIFSRSHTAYGFDQLSPLGKHIRQPLRNYFTAINKKFGSYAHYLKTKQYKRKYNKELFKQLSHTSLNQAHIPSLEKNPVQKKFFSDKCKFYSEEYNFSERMQALKDVFHSGQAGLAFFSINHFFNNKRQDIIEGRGRQVFRSIRENKAFAKKFLSYYKHLNFLPYIKLVYLNILETFQWINPVDLHLLRKQNLLELIKKPDSEAYISLLLLLKNNQISPGQWAISKNDLPKNYIQNIWSLLIFEKLKALAPDWQKDILDYCLARVKTAPAHCYQALNTLAHIQPHLKTAQQTVKFLDSKNDGLIFYTIRLLGQSRIKNYHVHKKIASFLTYDDPSIAQEALEALGFLHSPYSDIQGDIARLLPIADINKAKEIFWSLNRMDLKSDSAQKEIIQYAFKKWPVDKKISEQAFFTLQNVSSFSDFSLSFFYRQLESRAQPDWTLFIVEFLSKNKNLKDLGVHFRFLLFQKEKSALFRQKALEKMSHLIWLHPETQISFLNYMRDPDPIVRKRAVHILKNVKNLHSRALKRIKSLYKEEKIKELSVFFP